MIFKEGSNFIIQSKDTRLNPGFSLFSINGQQIVSGIGYENRAIVDTAFLVSGLYILVCNVGENREQHMFAVQ